MMFPDQKVKEKGSGTQFPVDFSTTPVTPDSVEEREREISRNFYNLMFKINFLRRLQ